jgi:hypothetical protein
VHRYGATNEATKKDRIWWSSSFPCSCLFLELLTTPHPQDTQLYTPAFARAAMIEYFLGIRITEELSGPKINGLGNVSTMGVDLQLWFEETVRRIIRVTIGAIERATMK